jgi:hypothetical protein
MLLRGRLPEAAKRHVRLLLLELEQEGSIGPGQAAAQERLPYPFERKD